MVTLGEHCMALAKASLDAGEWIQQNPELVRSELDGLASELRRSARLFRQCARSAQRKMCAGVFGPSQAGKSYLISALARDASGGLLADFGAESRDFISEINPEGGKESTGLVTRFTMTRPAALPEGFPVQIRLLTETDLVKIIANTYYADCEHRDTPDTRAMAQALDRLEARTGQGAPHITLDVLEDLREYLVKDFRAKPRVQELERSYWTRALELGQRLALDDRVALYSVIWDGVEPFTELLRELLHALDTLRYAPEAFCPLEALIPRDGSIIDVGMLKGLGETDGGPTLEVRTPGGVAAALPRAVVTALTAELTIVMREKPDDYFDYTDLLDFPGYRSRYKFDDVRRELQKPDMRKEMFLRGKVAYLFQRYCAERELTSMLLCIGPSNQEVQDLPGVINDWILSTHGEDPRRRMGQPVALYFVLTKFDMEFEQKKGAPSVETRWDNRLHASLLDFFGKQHDWPRIWDGERGFDNLFLLRNPNFRFDAILDYETREANGQTLTVEKGIRPDQQKYVESLERAFLNSAGVAAHFRNPREAWDAAMLLNDGGITRIRESLRPLCDPEIKRRQIRTTLTECQQRLALRLKAFYRTDDKEEVRRQKEALAVTLSKILANMASRQQFGEFLRLLCVNDHDLYELYFEAERRSHLPPDDSALPVPEKDISIGPVVDAADLLDELFADDDAQERASTPREAETDVAPRRKDEAQYFSELIESHWFRRMHELSDTPVVQKFYSFPGQEFSCFISELVLGAARLELRRHMEEALRKAAHYANAERERLIWQQVSMAAAIINSYVDWLGYNPRTCDEQARTVIMRGRSFVLFSPKPPIEGFPILTEAQESYEKGWYMDWLRALYALLMDNVHFDGEQTFNVEQNTLLGTIIQRISQEATAEML